MASQARHAAFSKREEGAGRRVVIRSQRERRMAQMRRIYGYSDYDDPSATPHPASAAPPTRACACACVVDGGTTHSIRNSPYRPPPAPPVAVGRPADGWFGDPSSSARAPAAATEWEAQPQDEEVEDLLAWSRALPFSQP